MVQERPDPSDTRESGQVVLFRPRRPLGQRNLSGPAKEPADHEAIDPLAKYEAEDGDVDYRHRMLMNVIAVIIVAMLVSVGVWIADIISDMQKIQNCTMQGRQNCAPIALPKE